MAPGHFDQVIQVGGLLDRYALDGDGRVYRQGKDDQRDQAVLGVARDDLVGDDGLVLGGVLRDFSSLSSMKPMSSPVTVTVEVPGSSPGDSSLWVMIPSISTRGVALKVTTRMTRLKFLSSGLRISGSHGG